MSTELLLQTHNYEDSLHNRKVQGRSSLDTFIIPNRTRLPSSKPKIPEEFDFRLTKTLLDVEEMQKPIEPGPRTSSQRAVVPVAEAHLVHEAPLVRQQGPSGNYSWLPAGYDGPIDSTDQSRGTSTTWSTVSARIFTDSSTGSDHRETSEFVKEYNSLATQHGLPLFVAQPKVQSRVSSVPSTKSSIVVATKPHWLLRKILRKSSSSYNVKTKTKATKPVSKSVSVADLPKRGRVDLLKDKSLEELARLGGVSLLMLPTEFVPAQLAVPVGLCATGAYILQHGRNMPGIFRISGQMSTVNKLYDYYAQQIDAADKGPTKIRQTVTAAVVPSHISHNVHDVAAVFKKFLNAVPGGILGSLSLFTALQSIHNDFYACPDVMVPQPHKVRARLIALAISSVTSQFRVSLICAVLGLVAVIGHENQAALDSNGANSDSNSAPTTELMGCKALGLVFAPLVIGDLTDDIPLQPECERGGVLSVPDSSSKRRKGNKRKVSMPKFPGMSNFLDMSGARYKIVAGVFEMLLINWKDIVPQLRSFGGMRGQSTSPVKRRQLTAEPSKYSLSVAEDRLRAQSSADWEGSLKVKKNVTIRTSSPALFPSMQGSNGPDANMRFESRESLTVSMKGSRQASSQLLSIARAITPALIEEGMETTGHTDLIEPAAVAQETAVTVGSAFQPQTPEHIKADLPETVRRPVLDREANCSDPFIDQPAQVGAIPDAAEKLEVPDLMTIDDQLSLEGITDVDVAQMIDEAEKIAASRQASSTSHVTAASVAPDVTPATNAAVETDAPQPPPPSHSRQPSATHTRKTSAPAIAAAHGFAIFLPAKDGPPSTTGTTAPKSPRALRIGSVKQIVRHISRSTESSRSSDETLPRREALMAGLARQGSVKEAAQRLAAAAKADDGKVVPAGPPAPRIAAPRLAAPKGSMIPKPVAPRPSAWAPSSPTMGEKLREAQREARAWRERAEWAERRLGFRMGAGGKVVPA